MEQSSALPAGAVSMAGKGMAGRAAIIAGLGLYLALLGAAWWGMVAFLPDHLAFKAFGRAFDLKNIHDRILSNAMLMFLILPSALWLECVIVGWQKSSARQMLFDRTASVKTDMAFFILGQAHVMDILGRLMLLGVSMISGLWIRDWLRATTGFAVDPSALPAPLQLIVYFFVYTFFDYWTHRLDHTRLFWPLHRYHHSARDFCVATAGRAHPAAFTAIFIVNAPMAILGAPPAIMLYVNVLVISLGFLIHSKIDSNWGWIGRWVIQSPNHHRLHHKLDMSHPTGHFAMAPIWDHLFGTWYGEADQSLVIGVETPYRHGYWVFADLFRDYWHFWKGFFQRPATA